MKITGDLLVRATKNTEVHRMQIQGYCRINKDCKEEHVIRDLTKPMGNQKLWGSTHEGGEFAKAHERMIEQIDLIEANLIVAELNKLLGIAAAGTGPSNQMG